MCAMNSTSRPFCDTTSSCSSILCSGVPVKTLISALRRPALNRPGNLRCASKEWVREQTFEAWTRTGMSVCGSMTGNLESKIGRDGSQASIPDSKDGLRVVGRRGASRMVCQRVSKVM